MRKSHGSLAVGMLKGMLFCLSIALGSPVHAHLEGTCLMRLADAAEEEKRCQISKLTRDQCAPEARALQAAAADCQRQIFIAPDIEHAVAHGQDRVVGDVKDSPYERSRTQAARHYKILESNASHFVARFGIDRQHYLEMLDDHFDEPGCPASFLATDGRFKWVGSLEFRRWPIDRDQREQVPVVHWLFFQPYPRQGCIAPPIPGEKSAWGDPAIVNIPRELVQELAANRQQHLIFQCTTLKECDLQRLDLQNAYNEYTKHLKMLHKIEDCSIGAVLARGIQPTKVGNALLQDNSAFCQQKDIDALEGRVREYLRALEAALFLHGKLP